MRFKTLAKDLELIKKYGLENKFIAGYIGTHGMAHSLETILDVAAKILKHDRGFRFYMVSWVNLLILWKRKVSGCYSNLRIQTG